LETWLCLNLGYKLCRLITGGQKAERHWRLMDFIVFPSLSLPDYRGAESRKALETGLVSVHVREEGHDYRGAESRKALETTAFGLVSVHVREELPGGRKPKGIGDGARAALGFLTVTDYRGAESRKALETAAIA